MRCVCDCFRPRPIADVRVKRTWQCHHRRELNANDADVVHVLLNKPRPVKARLPAVPSNSLLSDRERDVLRWISLGASNKTTAQTRGGLGM
jgi:DNA-binding NarL/FixJ family response regulator